jgi:hypothetical protein
VETPPPAGKSRRGLIIAVALVIAAAGIAALVVLSGDEGDEPAPSATPPVVEETTTTTTSAEITTTTTTTAPTTTSSTTRRATTTTARTTTTQAQPCGSGKATATFDDRDATATQTESSFVPQATVRNDVSMPIVVAELVYDVPFDGAVRRVSFDTARTVIRPGATATFTADRVSGPGRYRSAVLVRFTYHTEGRPADCRVSAP